MEKTPIPIFTGILNMVSGILAMYDGMREKILSYTDGLFSLAKRDGKFFRLTK